MAASSVGADPHKVADLASSLHFFKIPTNKIPNALSGVVRMGQMGPVDADVIAEHAKEIFEQLGGMGGNGYQGLRAVLPLAESSALGAATPAQALTNARDFVNDIISPNLDNAAGRIKINGKKIHWHESIIKMMGQGIDPLEAAITIVNKAIGNDKQYQSLNRKLTQTSDPTQRDRIERQIQAVRGVYVGKFFRNQQARMAFIGYEQHYDKVKSLQGALDQEYYGKTGNLATDKDMTGVYQEPAFKTQQAASLAMLDANSVLKPGADIWGDIAGGFTKLDETLPNVTKGLVALGLALAATASVAGTGVVIDSMLGTGGTKKVYQSLKGTWKRWRGKAGEVVDETVHGAEDLGEEALGVAKTGTRAVAREAGPAATLLIGAYDAYKTHENTALTPDQRNRSYTKIESRTGGALTGAEGGAEAGSLVLPGWGTAAGAIIGGIAGYVGGDWFGGKVADNALTPKTNQKNNTMTPMDALGLNPQRLDVHLYIDGKEIHSVLDDRTNRDALRH